jgi:hypothetical protein
VFLEAYNYEVSAGLFARQDDCKQQLKLLGMQQFGPPSAFEVMNMACKGACDAFMNRVYRLRLIEAQTHCTCRNQVARCPKTSADFLCALTGFCYEADWYHASTCAPSACGRWATNEADYRSERKQCNLYLDGASTAAIAGAALAAAVAAGLVTAAGAVVR